MVDPARTFQLGFILSLVVGLGVGETLFGRFGSTAHAH
jgi:copper transporter 1